MTADELRALNVRVHAEIFNGRILSVEEMRSAFVAWCGEGTDATLAYEARTTDGHWFGVVPHAIVGGEPSYRQDIPNYAGSIADAWRVHQAMCARLFSVRLAYFAALQNQTEEEAGFRVSWPDVLVVLRDRFPEAICRAALQAVTP